MLNIAEGNGKTSARDKRNFMVIARASAFESGALVHFLDAEKEISSEEASFVLLELEEISKMLYSIIRKLE